MIIQDITSCEKKYSIIYTDPPWPLQKTIRRNRPNQTRSLDYPTMLLPEIEAFHRQFLAQCADERHNVFMWCIEKYLHEVEDMMKSIGYRVHVRLIWNKGNGVAPAFTVHFTHEYLLWFFRTGHILLPAGDQRGKFATVFSEPSTVHSRKPTEAYTMLEAMFPGKSKIELFARNERDGWDSYGNELP